MCKKGVYYFWSREEMKDHLLRQCAHYKLPPEVLAICYDACNSIMWNPTTDYDGCTVVQDRHHLYLPCFIHDYMWVTGMGGKESDELFYKLLKATGMTSRKSKLWYLGVRIGWILGYRRMYIRNRNINPFTENVKKAFNYYGIPYST
jgi:hypothetical protein